MAPLNFPNNPGIGSVYTDSTSGFSYQWNGTVWRSYSAAASSNILVIDNISGSFNGSNTTFGLASGGSSITPTNSQQLRIVLGGVVQSPGVDYFVSGSSIVFTDPPTAGLTFSGVLFGTAVPITTIPDGTSTQGSLNVSTALTANTLGVTGLSTFINGPIIVGTATSTGTATQRLQVTGNAYVSGALGIGVTNPSTLFQINATPINATGNSDVHGLRINAANSSTAIHIGANGTDGYGWIQSATWGTSYRNTILNPIGGNVGIATTNPTSRLHVIGDARISGVVTATSFVGSGAQLTGIPIPQGYNDLDNMLFG